MEEIHWKNRLRQERIQRNWRQSDLAEKVNTSVVTVQRWEKGSQKPGPYFRLKLSLLFGKSAADLGFVAPLSSPSLAAQEEHMQEVLPAPGLALWNVPHSRNPHFTGREDLLIHLQRRLAPPAQEKPGAIRRLALTQAIKGLGGIGKTQIAIEYAYRAQESGHYKHILWINANNEEAIFTSFLTLAQQIPGLPSEGETNRHKVIAAVKRWLEECPQSWLLLVDNADELSLVQPYLPQRGQGSLLLTTRAHAVGAVADSLEVEVMGLVEGAQLLLHRAQRLDTNEEESNEAINVVIALEGFPLALDQAGAYIEETGCSFVDYLQLYQLHRRALLARRGTQISNYPDSVATTWLLSLRKVEQASPAAAELLRLCAFLAPDHIPEEVLTEGAAHWPDLLGERVADPFAFNELVKVLLAFSLVKRLTGKRVLSVHRLVQVIQREALVAEEQHQWAERVVRAINTVFPSNPKDNVTSWPLCLRYLEQTQACDGLIQEYQLRLPEAAELLERTGHYLVEQAFYTLARPLYQRALHLRELQGGQEHPLVASVLNGLANLHWKQGEYTEAEQLFQRALHIWEQQLGPEHPDMALALNGLAGLHWKQGEYTEAEQLYQRALHIRTQQLGPEHPLVASEFTNLAILYTMQGRDKEAERLYQQALHIWEQQPGLEHPLLTSTLNGLANIYRRQDRYGEAEQLYQRALSIFEQQFGPEYPGSALPLSGLAGLYTKQGRYGEAEPLYQQALYIWERKLGAEHPEMAFPLNNLAELHRKQGKYGEAERLYQRVLQLRMLHLGPEHPLLASTLSGLASLFRECGNYAEAETLYQRALPILERTLDPFHYLIAQALHDFALLKEARGNPQEAVSMYKRALTIWEHVYGPEHAQTIETGLRLKVLLVTLTQSDTIGKSQ